MDPGPAPFSPPEDKTDPFSPAPQTDPFGTAAPTQAPPTSPQAVFVGQPAPALVDQPIAAQPGVITVGASPMGFAAVPATSAVTALVLAILSWVCGGLCLSIPAVIIASNALAVTNQHPGHPDAGTAKAAQITAWLNIILSVLFVLFYAIMIMFAIMSEGGDF